MPSDSEILADIDAAFLSVERPEHFTNYSHCQDCAEHDELLRSRDRETLKIEDVGNICWQPISFCLPEGIAYFFPSLARFALSEPTHEYGWYGDTLSIHLSSEGESNEFLAYCNTEQRRAVAALIEHLNIARASLECRLTDDEEMKEIHRLWSI